MGDDTVQPTAYKVRLGATNCEQYLHTGQCSYGSRCWFNHPTVSENTKKRVFFFFFTESKLQNFLMVYCLWYSFQVQEIVNNIYRQDSVAMDVGVDSIILLLILHRWERKIVVFSLAEYMFQFSSWWWLWNILNKCFHRGLAGRFVRYSSQNWLIMIISKSNTTS